MSAVFSVRRVLSPVLESLQKLILPDRWQAAAIQALRTGCDVVVDAPTGAGKTFIFERWAEQTNFSRRALFTVPTRALANDKYAEWRARGWRVGIVTGDVTIDPAAPIVVATLEAVQNVIGDDRWAVPPGNGERPAPARRSAESAPYHLLVIDEYHWLADPQRGNHYEGVLLSAPPALQLLLLSGAVDNPEDAAAWLRRLGRDGRGRANARAPRAARGGRGSTSSWAACRVPSRASGRNASPAPCARVTARCSCSRRTGRMPSGWPGSWRASCRCPIRSP
jgi:hypothetical protein